MRKTFFTLPLWFLLLIVFFSCKKIQTVENDSIKISPELESNVFAATTATTCGCTTMPPVSITKNLVTDFGAIPNDGLDDSKAFLCAANWLNNNWSLTSVIQLYIPGGNYNAGVQLTPGQTLNTSCGVSITNSTTQTRKAVDMIKLTNAKNIVIYGATNTVINYNNNLYFGGFDINLNPVPAVYPNIAEIGTFISLNNSSCINIKSLKINGNNTSIVALGHLGGTGVDLYQFSHDGIIINGSNNVSVTDVTTSYFGRDGILLMAGTGIQNPQCPTLTNVQSNYNSRQGLSLTAGDNLTATGCSFSYTSQVFVNNPGSGLDIEPAFPGNTVNNASFSNCKFLNNKFCGMISDNHPNDVNTIKFNTCEFSTGPSGTGTFALWPYKMSNTSFTSCTIRGQSTHTQGINTTNLLKFISCSITDWNGSQVGNGNFLINNGWGENYYEFNSCKFETHKSRIIYTSTTPGNTWDRYFIKNNFKVWVDDLLASNIPAVYADGFLGSIYNGTLKSNSFGEQSPTVNNIVKYEICINVNTGYAALDNNTDGLNTFATQNGISPNPFSRFVRNTNCSGGGGGFFFSRANF